MKSPELPELLASSWAAPATETFPLDRIRMQKAIFLLTQRGPAEWKPLYNYQPYNWGPYSSALANDVRHLVEAGEMTVEPVKGSSYGTYRTTDAGDAQVAPIWNGLPEEHKQFVRNVRRYVTSKSFNKLLREVYAAYPEFAVKSQFTG